MNDPLKEMENGLDEGGRTCQQLKLEEAREAGD